MIKAPIQLKLGISLPNYEEDFVMNTLQQFGIYAKSTNIAPRNLKFERKFIKHPGVDLISCLVKPKDIFILMQMGYIDFALCLKQTPENGLNIVIVSKEGLCFQHIFGVTYALMRND